MKKRTGFAIAAIIGVVATVIFTAKDTASAVEKINEVKPQTFTEKVKTAAPCYIRTGVAAAATVGSIMISHHLGTKEIAGAGTFGAVIARRFNKYRQRIRDEDGPDRDEEIYAEVISDDFCMHPPLPQNYSEEHPDKKFLFYDVETKKWFWSTFPKVIEAMYHLNRMFQACWEVTLDQWCEYNGMKLTHIEKLELKKAGWNCSHFLEELGYDFVWIDFYTEYVKRLGKEPYYKIYFSVSPSEEALNY